MGDRLKGLRTATSLLTRVPAGVGEVDEQDLSRAVTWFPVVGALVGLVVAGVYVGLGFVAPPLLAAAIAVGAGVLLTGALHEDGLADMADALGGREVDERLRIMKDPTHGTYGVLAIALSVVVRVAALGSLDASTAVAVLVAAHVLSRTAAVAVMAGGRPASATGLAAGYLGAVRPVRIAVAVATGLALGTVALGPYALPAAAAAGLVGLGVALASRRLLGGLTGDVLGATQQLCELAILTLATTLTLADPSAAISPLWSAAPR